MSAVEAHWREQRCRIEEGFFFSSDEFAECCGSPAEGYHVDLRAPIASLLAESPDGWTSLDERCSAEGGDWVVRAGESSWEAEGFVAVEHRATGRLLWLLHLSESEPFIEVSCDGVVVRAVSEQYPIRIEWMIPIEAPESLTVSLTKGL